MKRIPLHRVQSDANSIEAIANKNVNWVGPQFYFFYAFCMIIFEWAVRITFVSTGMLTPTQGYTTVHCVHGIVNFFVMHYTTGSPGELGDQGEFNEYTWWEQLDDGVPWTPSRKVLMSIPIILFLVTSHLTNYDELHLVMNLTVLCLALIPKLPQLHRVRLGSERAE